MATFIYSGESQSISIAGRHVARGIPTQLEGRAADTAREHPDFEEVASDGSEPKAKAGAKPRATRSSTRKTTATKSTRPTKGTPTKSEPSTPLVSSSDPTPASTEINPNDI